MTRTGPVGVGIIGAGMISDYYLENLTKFPDLHVVAIADIDQDRAAQSAQKWGVSRSGTADDILSDDDVEIIVNLTIPKAHVPVSTAALRAGKHVWSEKPIGVAREEALALVELARSTGLRLGIAPDTLLGPGWQTAKRAIESGVIGTPLSAVTSFQWQGPDLVHPNPDFLFAPGGGPLFDMGPYYFSALVHLLGPVASIAAVGSTSRDTRRISVGPRAGEEVPVTVPTHVSAVATLENGIPTQSLFSFDTPLVRHGIFEVNGTEGTIFLPDPNMFGGAELRIARNLTDTSLPLQQPWETLTEEGATTGRGLGALLIARAIRAGGDHVATGELGYHVLDIMLSVEESIAARSFIDVASSVGPVPSLPRDFDPFQKTL